MQSINIQYNTITFIINPLMLTAAKNSLTILAKANLGKIFEGEMLFKGLQTTLLQIFCKIILNFKVVIESIIGPDNFVKGKS